MVKILVSLLSRGFKKAPSLLQQGIHCGVLEIKKLIKTQEAESKDIIISMAKLLDTLVWRSLVPRLPLSG